MTAKPKLPPLYVVWEDDVPVNANKPFPGAIKYVPGASAKPKVCHHSTLLFFGRNEGVYCATCRKAWKRERGYGSNGAVSMSCLKVSR